MKLYLQAKGTDRWIALEPVCEFLQLDFERETYLLQAEEYFLPHISTKKFPFDGEEEAEHLGLNEQGFIAWIHMKEYAQKYAAKRELVWKCYLQVYAFFRKQDEAYIEVLESWEKVGKDRSKREEQKRIIDAYHSLDAIKAMIL